MLGSLRAGLIVSRSNEVTKFPVRGAPAEPEITGTEAPCPVGFEARGSVRARTVASIDSTRRENARTVDLRRCAGRIMPFCPISSVGYITFGIAQDLRARETR